MKIVLLFLLLVSRLTLLETYFCWLTSLTGWQVGRLIGEWLAGWMHGWLHGCMLVAWIAFDWFKTYVHTSAFQVLETLSVVVGMVILRRIWICFAWLVLFDWRPMSKRHVARSPEGHVPLEMAKVSRDKRRHSSLPNGLVREVRGLTHTSALSS